MANLTDVCDAYGISRSTALRRIKACFGDAPKQGNAVFLDASQMQILSDYLEKHGDAKTPQNTAEGAPEMTQLRIELARAEERAASLARENASLRDELERVHAALEREQRVHVGFWHRLGHKLLGEGTRD